MQNWRNKITFTGSSDENLSGVSHQFCIGKRKHANTGKMLAVILTVMISLLMCHNMGKKLINKKYKYMGIAMSLQNYTID